MHIDVDMVHVDVDMAGYGTQGMTVLNKTISGDGRVKVVSKLLLSDRWTSPTKAALSLNSRQDKLGVTGPHTLHLR